MLEAIGLLVLTGVLWGCTNPFIRQGTKGLRDVSATTVLGQVWAEVIFLLGNWKYVLPWLVNQAGSLSYLAAVQRAPLSVAVPVANSLAFVFTAVTGASIGAEEPLDKSLLVLTGVLWGCTNPFIRQGTKGLRDVSATTVPGQVWAEVTFLLGNWKYVLPWLVNQAVSLSYLAAVQRAPLSVAVPVANSLAFVFTAVTGASIGAEEPLDKRSIVGIVLIMAGTALCCFEDPS